MTYWQTKKYLLIKCSPNKWEWWAGGGGLLGVKTIKISTKVLFFSPSKRKSIKSRNERNKDSGISRLVWFVVFFCFDLPSLDWLQDDIKYEDLLEKMTDQYFDVNFGFYL